MHFTVKSVFKWKKIEMVVQKLLILVLQELICFMKGKNMVLKNDDFNF
jgi:hypothetical protein